MVISCWFAKCESTCTIKKGKFVYGKPFFGLNAHLRCIFINDVSIFTSTKYWNEKHISWLDSSFFKCMCLSKEEILNGCRVWLVTCSVMPIDGYWWLSLFVRGIHFLGFFIYYFTRTVYKAISNKTWWIFEGKLSSLKRLNCLSHCSFFTDPLRLVWLFYLYNVWRILLSHSYGLGDKSDLVNGCKLWITFVLHN